MMLSAAFCFIRFREFSNLHIFKFSNHKQSSNPNQSSQILGMGAAPLAYLYHQGSGYFQV